jgi:DNA-binding CsgD family transcriptional regulator
MPEAASDWPLLERTHLRDRIVSQVDGAVGRAVFVTGPAGIGKSVLARQAADAVPARDVVHIVGLTELSGVPLGAFAPVLADRGWAADPGTAHRELLAHCAHHASGIVLLVDDAPRLDELSASALYQVVRAFGIPLIATARLGEPLPAPLVRLESEGLATTEPLDGLGVEDVAAILAARFAARPHRADVVRLAQRTEGNALYLRVLVEGAVRHGGVSRAGGEVTVHEGPTPPQLLDSIGGALHEVDAGARVAARVIALTQPVARPRLESAGVQERHVLELLRRGLVIGEEGSPRLRAAHPLIVEALATDLSSASAVGIAIAVLRASGEPGDRFAAIRLERESLGVTNRADLTWAAEHALAVGDVDAAATLAADAVAARDENTSQRALLAYATALAIQGRLDQADQAFREAEQAATEPGDRALLASRWGEHLAFRRFDVAAAVELAERVQLALPPDVGSALDAELKLWRGILGQLHEREADLDAAEAVPEVGVRAAMAAIMTETMSGRSDAARAAADVLTRVQQRAGVLDPMAAALVGFDVYIDVLSHGEHERALAWAQSRRIDAGDGVGIWTTTVAEHLNYNGRAREARDMIDLAVEQCRWRDPIGVLPLALAVRADVTAKLGDLAGARRLLDEMEPAQRAEPKAVMLIAECEAWLAHANGDTDGAVAIIETAARGAMDIGFHLVAAISLGLCIRMGRVERAATMLEESCAAVPPDFGLLTSLRDVAVAVRDRRPHDLADAARRLAAAGMAPTALDAISLAQRMRPGSELRRRLSLTAMSIGRDVDAPALQGAVAALLTDREREIAVAAARRLRSKEIAAMAGISVRTVDNQLQSVYKKLGVGSRDELRIALHEVGMLGDDG